MTYRSELALFGGEPVVYEPWPVWPHPYPSTRSMVDDVLDSGVWAISARSHGRPLQTAMFCSEFAAYVGRRWCVETDHGTSALVVALETLGIGPGDDVVVPALTWVACAGAVLQVGARPVFVDVDAESLCLTAAGIQAAVTVNTRCIMVVHLTSSAADMEGIVAFAADHDIHVIEDCAQAHGAVWQSGRRVGTHGVLSTFSFQNGKTLSAGEGGAVLGDDESLRETAECCRADGRARRANDPAVGEMYLEELGTPMGVNYCMPELSAAILRAALPHLDSETEQRATNSQYLDELFSAEGIDTIRTPASIRTRSVYEYGVYIAALSRSDAAQCRRAIAAELGNPVFEIDAPVPQSKLYRPETKPRFRVSHHGYGSGMFPIAESAHLRLAMIPNNVLLADHARMSDVVTSFLKVRDVLATIVP